MTLSELQTYIKNQCEARGWTDRTDPERIMLLAEEVGELAKEVRKQSGKFGYKKPDSTDDLAEELVDVLNWILDIANTNNVDLNEAFHCKWAAVEKRTWDI